MSPSLLPPAQGKSSWWSRAKNGNESSFIRPVRSSPSSINGESDKSPMSSMFPSSVKSKESTGSRFRTLGSAITFKSKRIPSLAIQDPPADVPIQPPPPRSPPIDSAVDLTPLPTLYSDKRPVAKSIRTARSTEFDNDAKSARTASEPRTPSDYRTSYQPSVLTFSELDPFASGAVIVQQGPDTNRLSAYSDSSMLEPSTKRGEILFYNRISYASSSKSQGRSSDSHSMGLVSSRSSRLYKPEGSRQVSDTSKDDTLAPASSFVPWRTSPSGSSGSTVVAGERSSRLSEPSGIPRIPPSGSRIRGMTISSLGSSEQRRPSTAGPPLSTAVPARLRKASDSSPGSSKGSSTAFSSGPSATGIGRSRSATVNSAESFESPNLSPRSMSHPLVVVRKASSTKVSLPPPARAPSDDLPPTPFPESIHSASDSLDDLALFPDVPSSSSSSLSFAPSLNLDMDAVTGDMINHLMLQSFDEEVRARKEGKGRVGRRKASSTSPSDTLRDFELVQPGPSSSTSKLPWHSSAGGYGGSTDLGEVGSPGSLRSLKRASSQQSLLGKRHSGASQSSVVSGSISHEDGVSGRSSSGMKMPRKQRSFHHARLPLPPLPALRHATSDMSSPSPSTLIPEQRKSLSGAQQSSRKRLFSNSGVRRSTSSHGSPAGATSGDEDNRSIYSVDDLRAAGQKIVMSFGSFANPLSLLTNNACVAPASYLPEPSPSPTSALPPEPETPRTPTGVDSSKRVSQSEYIPQHIMSPAEMLELERELAEESADKEQRAGHTALEMRRQASDSNGSHAGMDRRLSIVSAATSALGTGDSPRSSRDKTAAVSTPLKPAVLRSPAVRLKSEIAEASRLPLYNNPAPGLRPRKRSLTARPPAAQPSSSTSTLTLPNSPEQSALSLPPPPRSRAVCKTQSAQNAADNRLSIVPMQPLSPPPPRHRGRLSSLQGPSSHHSPTPSVCRPPSSFDQRFLKRKTVMKKPSFLDIEDEADTNAENLLEVNMDVLESPTMDSSFLDMERGKDSFDTVRSSDSLLYA